MASRLKTPAIALAAALVALVLGILWGGHPQSLPSFLRDSLVEEDVATRAKLAKEIKDSFYKSVPSAKLEEASLKGMVESLDDRFSQYFTPKEAGEFAQALSGKFEGVGMSVNSRDTKKGLRVARVFDKSPAKEAGLRQGDLIVAVNGKSILGQKADVATAKIRGKAGTEVTLSYRRGEKGKKKDVTLTRRKLDVPLIEGKVVKRGGRKLAVIRLAEFDEGAHEQLRAELDKSIDKKGAKGVVLDLRANPGGALDEGVLVASQFLPEGKLVVSTRGRTQPERKYKSTGEPIDPSLPVIVLVDSNSASASEIVTGALRDHERATIVGQKTFGKGVFQEIVALPNDGLIKLTVGSYFLPEGKNLAGDGIEPSVKAKDDPKTRRDEALPAALRALQAKLKR